MGALAILEAITGVAEVATNVVSGVLQNRETGRANEENLALADKYRKDVLSQNEKQNAISRGNLALSRDALEFQMEESEANRAERMEEKGYNRMQNAANRYAEYLNYNNSYQQSKLSSVLNR